MGDTVPEELLARFNRIAADQGVEPLDHLDAPDIDVMDGTWLVAAVNSVLRPEYRAATTARGFSIAVHPDVVDLYRDHLGSPGSEPEDGVLYRWPCADLYNVLEAAI